MSSAGLLYYLQAVAMTVCTENTVCGLRSLPMVDCETQYFNPEVDAATEILAPFFESCVLKIPPDQFPVATPVLRRAFSAP